MSENVCGLSQMKWMCKYHIVFAPKYRGKVIYNQIRSDLGVSSGGSAGTRG